MTDRGNAREPGEDVHSTRNEVGGQVAGSVVQANDIHGNVYLYNLSAARFAPRQLPASTRHFVGRVATMEWLSGILAESGSRNTPAIAVLSGLAGIGKTAVAVHWAHSMAERFPDGQLYVNLRGFDPTRVSLDPDEAIRGLLEAFVNADNIPADPQGRLGLYRSVLADRRILLLLDNARDAEQVRPLLPAGLHCFAIVTSRDPFTSLAASAGARLATLDLLSAEDSSELIVRHLGQGRAVLEPEAVKALVAQCSRLPLALSIVGARAAAQPAFPISLLEAELTDIKARLDALDGGDETTNVRAAFSWSFEKLSPPAARMFGLLGMHPGPEVSLAAAASLGAVTADAGRRVLRELTRAQLLTEHQPSRFTFHDLLRAYAAEVADRFDDQDRHDALARMYGHYLYTAYAGARLLNPVREPITLPPLPSGVHPETLTNESVMHWFAVERPVLTDIVSQAAANGFYTHAWQIAWTLVHFLDRQGFWQELKAVQSTAFTAAQHSGDLTGQALCLRYLGGSHTLLGEYDDAETNLHQALGLSKRAGDLALQARIWMNLGWTAELKGDLGQAITNAQCSLELFDRLENQDGRANALFAIGRYRLAMRDYQGALESCRAALDLFKVVDNGYGEAGAWDAYGLAHQAVGDHDAALACFRRAHDLYAALGVRYYQAKTLDHAGESQRAVNAHEEAVSLWHDALDILVDLEHPDAESLRAKLAETKSDR